MCGFDPYNGPGQFKRVLTTRLAEAEAKFETIGVASTIGAAHYGPLLPNAVSPIAGWVVDRDRVLRG